MGDRVLPPNNNMFCSSPDPLMDLDFDDLFFDGCWLGTNYESELLNHSPTSNSPFDPSFIWASLEDNNGEPSGSSSHKDIQGERQLSTFSDNLSISQPQEISRKYENQAENQSVEGFELSKKWWIGPRPNHDPTMSVMERLIWALEYFKGTTRDKDVLLQIWVPVNKGGRRVLSTSGQPFSLDLNSPRLASYRDISVKYQFPAEEDSKEVAGLPGRVFMGKVPEWTPDVRFFRREEYLRVGHAQQHDVRGTLAVPVFEQGSSNCLGVIEVVTTSLKINYKPELESVCKALEAVDLRGSEVASAKNVKVSCDSYQAALPEILEVLRSACETHRLPLAQTWVPCVQQGKEGCRHSDENLINCVSPVDTACYISEPFMKGFHEACSEHHLLKGQGIVGKAFMSKQTCFSPDITSSSKTEYPLSHHASLFGLCAAVAIRLRSIYSGMTDFVLEFFLPVDCRENEEQKKLLNSLSVILEKVSQSLRIITDQELQEETSPLFLEGKEREALRERGSDLRSNQETSTSRATAAFDHDYSNPGQGSFLNLGRTGEMRRIKADKHITLEMLRQYFAGSLKDAAKNIGVCPTTLKRICRQHGITRWPSRKIKKVGHSLRKIQGVIDSVQVASGGFQIKSFYSNFPELASPNVSKTSPFAASKPTDNPKSQNEDHNFSPEAAAFKSPSSSCSRSSSSSQCCSGGTQPQPYASNDTVQEDPVVRDKSLIEHPESKCTPTLPKDVRGSYLEGDRTQRAKVTYGEEKIRFRMVNSWGYEDLVGEIMRRFGIDDEDKSGFQVKYLDDDSEWVLLTCNDDLQECVDVCQSIQGQTIKFYLHHNPRRHLGNSSIR